VVDGDPGVSLCLPTRRTDDPFGGRAVVAIAAGVSHGPVGLAALPSVPPRELFKGGADADEIVGWAPERMLALPWSGCGQPPLAPAGGSAHGLDAAVTP